MNHFTLLNLTARKTLVLFALLLSGLTTYAQVTTSALAGLVTDAKGEGLIGATVIATHVPSGSRYGTSTNSLGRYTLPAVRVGGPFTIVVTYTGYEAQTREGIFTSLGTTADADFVLNETGVSLEEVVISSGRSDLISSNRTGASSTFNKAIVTSVPTIGSRTIQDITKYNPNGNGRSFGGQDSRLNNFTIDGSVFNNGFGLGSDAQAGGRTGSTAISLDAIEEVQVNIAPFDVRQTGFVGAGVNAVTRSGDNEFRGSVFYNWRNANLYGNKARDVSVVATQFNEKVIGARIGGPIIKNKLFFFLNGEFVRKTEPGTPWVAAGSTNPGQVTRVAKADLEEVSKLLGDKFGYVTGPYEAFNNETTSDKFLARIDYNINDKNKLTLRYTYHESQADILISNSNSLGLVGNRTNNINSMAYQNSGYIIGDNTRSYVAELNSSLSQKVHNDFIIGYDSQNEDRQYKSPIFPTIDILKDGAGYISAGMDPFTPNNLLDYSTFHVTDNVNFYLTRHTVTAGVNYDRFKSNNSFFPGSNGVYSFNSLDDFRKAINGDSAGIARFQYRYSALEGAALPLQVLNVSKYDAYVQDEYQVSRNFRITLGVRASLIDLSETKVLQNNVIADSTFRDLNNQPLKINTGTVPDNQLLFEPRFGFNWDVSGKRKTQVRGGVGVFTGRPPYVWISNQVGNNGVLTGFIEANNTNTKVYPLVGDATQFTPATPTLPSTFEIAYTANDYKFPQVLKANLAVDQKLPFGLVGTVEFLYNQNVNAARYYNANLEPATARFAGPDNRPRFPGSLVAPAGVNNAVRVVNNVSSAAILTTTDKGYYASATVKLEYPAKKGLNGLVAYTYSQTKDLMNSGSIALGSFTGARSVNGNNSLDLSLSDQDIPHRVIGLLGYRAEFGEKRGGAVQFTIGYEGIQSGRYSYTYNGDMNGDGINGNDLLFVPVNATDLVFQDVTNAAGVVTLTGAQQATNFENYIKQDPYLESRRGKYTERNGAIFPWLHRFDLSASRDFWINIGQKRNTIQFRVDVLNIGNMLNSDWGVGRRIIATTPLVARGVVSQADPTPRYQTFGALNADATRKTVDYGARITDVWSLQFGIRYIFN